MWTGAPVASARSATPPRWSQWPCVTRIAAHDAPSARELEPSRRGASPPGSTTTASAAASVGAHDVAIRPDRAELETCRLRALTGRLSLTSASLRPLGSLAVQSWNLREIETPGGKPLAGRPPFRRVEARAVLIGLEPGQRARRPPGEGARAASSWSTARSASSRAARRSRAAPGTFFSFDAGRAATRSRATTGARILLVLAPWPGEGHYRGDRRRA